MRPTTRLGIGASHWKARAFRRQPLTKQAPRNASGVAMLATRSVEKRSVMAAPLPDARFRGSQRKSAARSRAQLRSPREQARSLPGYASEAIPTRFGRRTMRAREYGKYNQPQA